MGLESGSTFSSNVAPRSGMKNSLDILVAAPRSAKIM